MLLRLRDTSVAVDIALGVAAVSRTLLAVDPIGDWGGGLSRFFSNVVGCRTSPESLDSRESTGSKGVREERELHLTWPLLWSRLWLWFELVAGVGVVEVLRDMEAGFNSPSILFPAEDVLVGVEERTALEVEIGKPGIWGLVTGVDFLPLFQTCLIFQKLKCVQQAV